MPPPTKQMKQRTPHRHTWRLEKETPAMVFYKCRTCPKRLIEAKGNLVINDEGRLCILVKQHDRRG